MKSHVVPYGQKYTRSNSIKFVKQSSLHCKELLKYLFLYAKVENKCKSVLEYFNGAKKQTKDISCIFAR